MLIYRHLHVLQRYLRHIKKEKEEEEEEEEEEATTTKKKKKTNVNDPLIIKTTLIKTNDYFLFCTNANQMIETNETSFK